MALSQVVKKELQAELENLQAYKKKLTADIDRKIATIQAILSGDFFQPQLPMNQAVDVEERIRALEDNRAAARSNGSGTGVRAGIFSVLGAHPGGLRAKDVAAKLTERGIAPSGKTPLRTLVYGELYRLKRLQRVAKTHGGRFRIRTEVKPEGEANATA